MAHFAKLDDDNIVLEIHVVANAALDPDNEEQSGIAFLTEWSGGHTNWKQTSYNGTFRKHYAGVSFRYDEVLDAFIPPSPFPSWIFDETDCDWHPPVPRPENPPLCPNCGAEMYWVWNEDIEGWDEAPHVGHEFWTSE